MTTVDELKQLGNKAFSDKNYAKAIELYTDAIDMDPENYTLYSNRSGSYCASQKYMQAAADARKVIEIKPDWPRGHTRLGAALQGQKEWQGAADAFRKAIELDPGNQNAKEDLASCEAMLKRPDPAASGADPLASLFRPENFDALRYNPATAQYFNDPSFVAMINDVKANPNNAMSHMNDPRFQACLQAMLAPLMGKYGKKDGQPAGEDGDAEDEEVPKPAPKKEAPKPAPAPAPAPKKTANEEAEAEKELGNTCFKAGDMDGALEHYNKAIEIEPHNITFINNKATCLIKQKKFEDAVALCTKAIEEGRENHADFESIAKAYTKIASAEAARNNLEAAIAALNASLLEKKDPIVKRELTRLEQLKSKRDAAAYENPEIAEAEKNEGNVCFRNGDIPKAIEHYTEAIRRAPRDAKIYSNRAGAYSKLGEMPMALKDCEKAIELDPKFSKAYTRKGYCHIQMKEYHKALDAYNDALRIDPNNAEAIGGVQSVNAAIAKNSYTAPDEEQIRRNMADPEIQRILQDPGMQQILQEMQTNPMKAQGYFNDPKVREALMKLRAAGVVR